MRSTKDFRFKIKATGGSGAFVGLAAVYNNVDLGNDLIERGAFTRTLQSKSTVPLLWQHKTDVPIGTARLSDSPAGLQVDGTLLLEVPEAKTAYSLIKANVIGGLSIGYDPVRDSIDAAGIRHLEEIKLWEASIVTFPMNESAVISSVKSLDDARRILTETAKSSDAEQIAHLRSLLKDITQLVPIEVDEEFEEEDAEDEDALAAKSILQSLLLELNSQKLRTPLRW